MIVKTMNVLRNPHLKSHFYASKSFQMRITVCHGVQARKLATLCLRSQSRAPLRFHIPLANYWNRSCFGARFHINAHRKQQQKPKVNISQNDPVLNPNDEPESKLNTDPDGINSKSNPVSETNSDPVLKSISNKPIDKKNGKNQRPKKKIKRWYLIAGAVVFSGVIGYAKYDREFRQSLNGLIPGSDKLVAFTFGEDSRSTLVSQKMHSMKIAVKNYLEFGKHLTTSSHTIDSTQVKRKWYERSPKTDAVLDQNLLEPEKKQRLEAPTDSVAIKGMQSHAGVKTGRVDERIHDDPLNLVALEERMGTAAQLAIRNYTDAVSILRGSVDEVDRLIENKADSSDSTKRSAKLKSNKKDQLVKEAELNAKIAEDSIRQIKESIEKPNVIKEKEFKDKVENDLKKVLTDIAEAKMSFEKAQVEYSSTIRN